eukprot:GHVU01090390.1.p1 GENE.GHVU01090390.1~~GHVU01090390.1.p1  ORF type:complete len:228 (-),score=43.07 GHVU01090390.1:325-966(-)
MNAPSNAIVWLLVWVGGAVLASANTVGEAYRKVVTGVVEAHSMMSEKLSVTAEFINSGDLLSTARSSVTNIRETYGYQMDILIGAVFGLVLMLLLFTSFSRSKKLSKELVANKNAREDLGEEDYYYENLEGSDGVPELDPAEAVGDPNARFVTNTVPAEAWRQDSQKNTTAAVTELMRDEAYINWIKKEGLTVAVSLILSGGSPAVDRLIEVE